ncbi:wee1 protein kinase-like [Tropilaelaps mercedesae]|uniref:non-specific protein-tyrosine kinase n=1 Tax=Tropilaelaps mercedesae TaxID=418985 RepID=A0A1V9X4Z1_9ACAR|nr:wee1 protein kinase-like [Tropilaelaps mercedesae]
MCRIFSFSDNNSQDIDYDTSICSVEEQLERQAKIQRMYLSPNDEAYSRYEKEFLELEQIGNGEFGAVFKCIHRLDGCVYAIKKLKKPMQGSAEEKASLTEVWAHAVLGVNKHVVRYYSAWAEHNHMIIQNEFCNGGSLYDQMKENRRNEEAMTEPQLRRLTLHIAHGLKFIHGQNLVHMDIKPGNIFISRNETVNEDDGFVEDENVEGITYKIGDLGLVTSSVHPEVEEGDCRYMAPELLRDDHSNLQKADIFSLGLTIYEIGFGIDLPKNGDEWQKLRRGELQTLKHCSTEFNQLLQRMCHPQPDKRPTAQQLVCDSCLVPYADKSKAQLHMELNIEKFRSRVLEQKLRAALCFQVPQCPSDVRLNFDYLSNPPSFRMSKGTDAGSDQESNSDHGSKKSDLPNMNSIGTSKCNNNDSDNRHSKNDTNNNSTINNNTNPPTREFPAARRNLFIGRGTMRSSSVQNF